MTMRMVLVGLVAALGITTPTPTQCSQWWVSIRAVGSAVLADWDHWKPREKSEIQGAFHLTPVAVRIQSADDQTWLTEKEASVPSGPAALTAMSELLVAVHHVKCPTPEEYASRIQPKSWPDLPGDVFQNPVRTSELAVTIKNDATAIAAAASLKQSDDTKKDIPAILPPASPKLAEAINKDLTPVERPAESALAKPEVVTEIVPFGRSDDLEAWLLAGLMQAADQVPHPEQTEAPAPTPAPARCELENGPICDAALAAEQLVESDWADVVAAASVEPLQPDLATSKVDETQTPGVESDVAFDSAENPTMMSWSEAMASVHGDGESELNCAPGPQSGALHSEAISADLKQAMLLTRDAFNAWMNLVRRGSTFKITKR